MSAVAPEATPRGKTQSEDRAVLSPDGPVPPRPGAWEDAEVTHRKENALCGSLPGSGRAGLRFTVKVTADPGASVNDASAHVRGAGPPLRTQTSPGGSHIPAGAQAGTSLAACDALPVVPLPAVASVPPGHVLVICQVGTMTTASPQRTANGRTPDRGGPAAPARSWSRSDSERGELRSRPLPACGKEPDLSVRS